MKKKTDLTYSKLKNKQNKNDKTKKSKALNDLKGKIKDLKEQLSREKEKSKNLLSALPDLMFRRGNLVGIDLYSVGTLHGDCCSPQREFVKPLASPQSHGVPSGLRVQ